MPKLIKDRITISDGRISFDVKLREPITLVQGDSATGKTLFYKLMQMISINDNNIIFINIDKIKEADMILKSAKNKLIIIDNADIVLTDKQAKSIREDKYNQYILFGRDTERYYIGNRNLASLYESKPGHISLEYDIEV